MTRPLPRPGIAVLHNTPTMSPDHPNYESEADVVEVAKTITKILEHAGFEAWLQPAAPPLPDFVAELAGTAPSAVFNLVEGFAGQSRGEVYLTGMLELLSIPYTGCQPEAQALCHQKSQTKALLRGFGLPTAPFLLVSDDEAFDLPFEGPYFVKPDAQDASLGIDQGSVVSSLIGIRDRVKKLQDEFGLNVIVEAYLPGAEFNVGVLSLPDPVALPVAEIIHVARPKQWPILTYEAKWNTGSRADLDSLPRCPAQIDTGLSRRLKEMAVTAFKATGCRDYARVDFRLDAFDQPTILEVNPNPDLGPDAGWARALVASGRGYDATIIALAQQAIARGVRHG